MYEENKEKVEPKKTFRLSSGGLANAFSVNQKSDFKFFVGLTEPFTVYEVPSFFANFISPKVAMQHASDPSFSSFHVPIADENNSFQLIMDLLHGKSIQPTDIQKIALKEVAKALGNDELYKKCVDTNQLKITNAIPQMLDKYSNDMDVQGEIDFIANHFPEYKTSDFMEIPLPLLERIFSSSKLLIEDENSFFDTIYQIVNEKGATSQYKFLFSTLTFENLKVETLKKLCDILRPEDVTTPLWSVIEKRLISSVKIQGNSGSRYYRNITSCEKEEDAFAGIFYMLFQKYDGNPVEKNIVSVTAQGESSTNKAVLLFSQNKKNSWGLTETPGNYLQMDFKQSKVIVTGYSIRSASNAHWDNPQSWVLEGSDDGVNWTKIDEKVRNQDMGGNDKFHYWSCNASDEFRMIRWMLTERGSGGLYCRQFELFGRYITFQKVDDNDLIEHDDLSDDDEPLSFPFITST